MESELSGMVELGITLIVIAVVIAIAFSILGIMRSTTNEGITKVQTKLDELETETKVDNVIKEEEQIEEEITTKPISMLAKETRDFPDINIGWQGLSVIAVVLAMGTIAVIKANRETKINNNFVSANSMTSLKRSKDDITKDILEFHLIHNKKSNDLNKLVDGIYGNRGKEWYQSNSIKGITKDIEVVAANLDAIIRKYNLIMGDINKGKIKAGISSLHRDEVINIKDKEAKRIYLMPWYYIIVVAFMGNMDIDNFLDDKGDTYKTEELFATALKICEKVRDEIAVYLDLSATKTFKEAVGMFNINYRYDMSEEFYKNIVYIANNCNTGDNAVAIKKIVGLTDGFKCNYLM